jgi:hypothetical protein
MWKLGKRGGVRSALLGWDLDKSRWAGRGPMAIGMVVVVVGAGALEPWQQTCRTVRYCSLRRSDCWRKIGSKQTRFANRMTTVADYVSERDLQKRGEGCCLRRWVMSGRQAS